MKTPEQMSIAIQNECDAIKAMLLEKNKSYGNSVAEPVRIFSRSDPLESINTRIDDKLSRLAKGREFENEDTEMDLIGYLILRQIIKKDRE